MEQAGINNARDGKYGCGISLHTLRHYFAHKSFRQSEEKGRRLEQLAPYLSAFQLLFSYLSEKKGAEEYIY